jgi:hypothetical protein
MNYGFLEELQEVTAYILGKAQIPYIPFLEDGDWEPFLPKYENQTTKLGQETSGCTVWGSQNQIETLHRFLYGKEPNYSERYTYNLVPIDPGKGVDPHRTHETIRRQGLIDEQKLPMTDSIDEYLDTSAITGSLLAKGQYWLSQYDYRHEWLWNVLNRPTNYKEIIKDALRTCPIAVSVTAWRFTDGYYVSDNGGNNHYCLLYRIDDDGSMWVFDSYDHSKKRLHPDHNIRRAKRIWLQKKTKREMGTMIKLLQSVLKSLMKPTLYDVTKARLGTDVTPLDEVVDDVACAHSLTTLMKIAYPETPIMTGTATLYEWLLKQATWKKVDVPEPSDIIISPTGYGRGIGHCGVIMENDIIASNNSYGVYAGKFTENYTLTSWNRRYGEKQSLPITYFRRV